MDVISREALLKAFGLEEGTTNNTLFWAEDIFKIIKTAPELSCEGCVHDGMWDFDDDRPGPCDLCKRKAADWYSSKEKTQ